MLDNTSKLPLTFRGKTQIVQNELLDFMPSVITTQRGGGEIRYVRSNSSTWDHRLFQTDISLNFRYNGWLHNHGSFGEAEQTFHLQWQGKLIEGRVGVQQKVPEHYEKTHYMHCYAHQLDLIMQQTTSPIPALCFLFLIRVASAVTRAGCVRKQARQGSLRAGVGNPWSLCVSGELFGLI